MSFKSFLASLSTLELVFILLGIVAPILCLVWVFFTFRGNSTSIRAARMFLKRATCPGMLHKSRIESWQQTNTMYGNNYFFDIFFLSRRYPAIFSKSSGCPRTDAFVEKRSADSGEERR